MRGFDALIKINGIPVAAQINADVQRTASTADVTNRIKMEWTNVLPQLNSWRLTCSGAYVTSDEGLSLLEQAYLSRQLVDITLSSAAIDFSGKGAIINFPVGALFNSEMSYNITIQGAGPLERTTPDGT